MHFYGTLLLVIFLVLITSSFANKTTPNPCNFNVKVKQVLYDEGFHRNISYGIVFHSKTKKEKWLYQDCMLSLDQTLPPGVYANPDELEDLTRTNRLNAVPKGRVNVELTTELSSPSGVYVTGAVGEDKAHLWLPVHARYHQAAPGGGLAQNVIEKPKLYLRCPDERLDLCNKPVAPDTFLCNGSSKEKCSWKEIPFKMVTEALIWFVPVGDTNQYYLVTTWTVVTVVAGALYLLYVIHKHKEAGMKW